MDTNRIKAIQGILGVTQDGIFGPKSRLALEAVTAPDEATEMTKRFLDFMPFIFEWEGETFENDPDDPGGATKFGIDQRSHPKEDIANLTKARATEIYWQEWIDARCELKLTPFAEIFFNCAVNMGLGRANQFQSETVHAFDAKEFLTLQEAYYHRLAENHPHLSKFLKGWLNRTRALRERFNLA
jgi:lysozyme family protein